MRHVLLAPDTPWMYRSQLPPALVPSASGADQTAVAFGDCGGVALTRIAQEGGRAGFWVEKSVCSMRWAGVTFSSFYLMGKQ